MKRSDFILPLFLSAAVHLVVFVSGPTSNSARVPPEKEVSSISLKIVSPVAKPTPKTALSFDALPNLGPQLPPLKVRQPAREETNRKPKAPQKKVVKQAPLKLAQERPLVKSPITNRHNPGADNSASEKIPVETSPEIEVQSSAPAARMPPLEKAPLTVLRLGTPGNFKNESKESEARILAKIVGLVKPKYPRYCRRHDQEGTVVLAVKLDSLGCQRSIVVVSSSGYSRLDKAAIQALEKASFTPARIGGQAVPTTKRIAFRFRLKDAEK
ncbi:MAG: energy transducer TonB [Deltaproteobacteria bacterium]|nr:energy transducer TonB [Deltaproteobacteria bacterium]